MWLRDPHPFPIRGSPTGLSIAAQRSYNGWSCRIVAKLLKKFPAFYVTRLSMSGLGPGEKKTKLTTYLSRMERLTLSRRLIWAWSEKVRLYCQKIIILSKKTEIYAAYSGPSPQKCAPDSPHFCWHRNQDIYYYCTIARHWNICGAMWMMQSNFLLSLGLPKCLIWCRFAYQKLYAFLISDIYFMPPASHHSCFDDPKWYSVINTNYESLHIEILSFFLSLSPSWV